MKWTLLLDKVVRFCQKHHWSLFWAAALTVVSVALTAALFLVGKKFIYTPRCTAFALEGDTTALSFTSIEQKSENTKEAGLFATSVPSDLVVVGCSKLINIATQNRTISCAAGTLRLHKVSISSVELSAHTAVHLEVVNRNLLLTLVAPSIQKQPRITLSATDDSLDINTKQRVYTGLWKVEPSTLGQKIIVENVRLPAEDEGDQPLAERSSVRFEMDGQSGFVADTGFLLFPDLLPDQNKFALGNSRVQINNVGKGHVRNLTPLLSPQGYVRALHVRVTGISSEIQVFDPFTDIFVNRALSYVDQYSGSTKIRLYACFAFVAGLIAGVSGICSIVKFPFEVREKLRKP